MRLFFLAVCIAVTGAPRFDWTVHLRRAGPIRIGMTLPEVRKAIGDSTALLVNEHSLDRDCAYLTTSAVPDGISVMFNKGRVVRIDVDKAGLRTKSGVTIGDPESRLTSLYPKDLRTEPHFYDAEYGHHVTYAPQTGPNRGYGIRFDTHRGRIESIFAGSVTALPRVEGCF